MSTDPVTRLIQLLPPLELLRIVSLGEAGRLSGLSQDTLRRRYREKIKKLSKRRDGMRVCDALLLNDANTT